MSETPDQQFETIQELYTQEVIVKRFKTSKSCEPLLRLLELLLTSVTNKKVALVRVMLSRLEAHRNVLERNELYAECSDVVVINDDNRD